MSILDNASPQEYWDKQKSTFQEIFSKSFHEFAEKLPMEKAFRIADRSLRCIDEGTVGGLHLAGGGLLLGVEDTLRFVEEARVDGVFSHAGCGAATLYTEKNELDLKDADKYGEDFAQKIADKAGVPFLGHIGLMELKRPPGFHIARVVYYDGTGRFDYSQVEGLPSGFTISRRFLDPEYAKSEVDIAVSIATGDHGFGELITKDDPILLLGISSEGNGSIEEEELRDELEQVAKIYGSLVGPQIFLGTL